MPDSRTEPCVEGGSAAPADLDRVEPQPRRWQAGLKDLFAWVVCAAILARVLAGALRIKSQTHWELVGYEFRPLALGTVLLTVALGLRLAGQLVRLARGQWTVAVADRPSERLLRRAPIVWRAVALGLLADYVAELSRLLGGTFDFANLTGRIGRASSLHLTLLCGLMGLVGLVAGMGMSGPVPAERARRAEWSWLLAVLAGLVGVAFVTAMTEMPITHLVLVALESVGNAIRLHPTERAGLALRIVRSGPSAAVALAACVAAGSWIGRDLRAQSGRVVALSRAAVAFRLITLAFCAASTIYIVRVTIPTVHVWLSEGIWMVVVPQRLALIATGFAGLSAGIVARAIGRVTLEEPQRRRAGFLQVALRCAVGLLLLWLIFMAASVILWESGKITSVPSTTLGDLSVASIAVWNRVWSVTMPTTWFWVPAIAWAATETLRRCGPQAPDRISAFDVVASSPSLALRFLAYWFALTIVCLCALPTLFAASLVAYHFRLMGLNWP